MPEKQQVFTSSAPYPAGPYSQAILTNDFVFVAGQRPADPQTGKIVAGDIREQTHQVISNLSAILAASGSSLSQVVRSTVYLSDLGDFSAMNEVYAELFPRPYPVRTTIGAKLRGVLIEIDVIALREKENGSKGVPL